MRTLIGTALIVSLAACSSSGEKEAGAATEPAQMETESSGGELGMQGDDGAEASASAQEEQPAPEPAGKAQLTVRIVVGGEKVPGDVQVVNDAGDVVAQGKSGDTFAVNAGEYTLVGKVKDASIMVDTPSQESDPILIQGGDKQTEDVEIGRAKVRLKIYKGRREIRAAKVELRRQGTEETVYEYTPGKDYIFISPGRYDAVVKMGKNQEIKVEGLVFMPGATQDIPVRIQ